MIGRLISIFTLVVIFLIVAILLNINARLKSDDDNYI